MNTFFHFEFNINDIICSNSHFGLQRYDYFSDYTNFYAYFCFSSNKMLPFGKKTLSLRQENFKTMIIIGIAGGSGSGKTTVVKRIAKVLPPRCAAVIPLDSYYNDTTDLTDEERRQINFDHPDAFDWKLLTEQINRLKHGKAIEQPTYSYVLSNRLPETIHVDPKPVIILEGIMTLHYKKLRDMMDLKIYVDTDSDVRLIRNIRRDVVERGRTVEMVLSHYENDVKPMHEQFIEPTKKFADLIIPWGRENKRGIDILKTYIELFTEEVKEEMENL